MIILWFDVTACPCKAGQKGIGREEWGGGRGGRGQVFNTEAQRHKGTEKCVLDRINRINRMGCSPLYIFYISYTVKISSSSLCLCVSVPLC